MKHSVVPHSPESRKHKMDVSNMLCKDVNETPEDHFDLHPLAISSKGVDGEEILLPGTDGYFNIRVARYHCKARGVPDLHNPRNAFIDVPLDIVDHGGILICSHRTCSSSGRRFRYCSVCRCPVAKRNFVKRHGHGILKPKRKAASYVSDSESSENSDEGKTTKRSRHADLNKDPLPFLPNAPRLSAKEVSWLDRQSGMAEAVNQDDLNVWLKGIMGPSEGDAVLDAPSCSVTTSNSLGCHGDEHFFAV